MDESGKNPLTGRGKLLLFGEHSAVYGYPALGIPLPLKTGIIPRENPGIELSSEYEPYRKSLGDFIRYAEELPGISMGSDQKGFSLYSDIPPGSGLGSSAALCTALVRYLQYRGLLSLKNQNDLWLTAHRLEAFFHGTPSGIDTGLSAGESPVAFSFGRDTLPEAENLDFPEISLVYGTIPRQYSAGTMIQRVREQIRDNPNRTDSLLSNLGHITEQAVSLFRTGCSPRELGQLADQAHITLKTLQVSTPLIDQILKLAAESGSPGGKISGAGGGGAFWFLASSKDEAVILKNIISERFSCPLWIL